MKKLLILLFAFSLNLTGQIKSNLSGNLFFDGMISFDSTKYLNESSKIDNVNIKSPLLSGALSALIPGAGQIYNGDIWKALLFAAVEVAAISFKINYDKKGDDQTQNYQNFAEENWSVITYAAWTIKNSGSISNNPTFPKDSYNVMIYDNLNNPVGVNWDELNRLEEDLGNWYSHKLAPFGDQQYYEMIGKYPQFNMGWDDAGGVDASYTYGDPLSPNFNYYSEERGKANDFYNVASKAVVVIIINHILSAAEAIWSSSKINNNLSMKLNLHQKNLAFEKIYYPNLDIIIKF